MPISPWNYANLTYLNLKAKLDDEKTVVTLKIDRYLNNGLKLPRNMNAGKALFQLLNSIVGELKVKYPGPLKFKISDIAYDRVKLQRVFYGKGSPEDIRDVVRLASRYKLTDAKTVNQYCTANIGLDCNGFAGNFWGIDPETIIGSYDVNRRKAVADVASGDAMIYYRKGGSSPVHIAVVDEVKIVGKDFQVIIAQSAGPDQGISRFDCGRLKPLNTKSGDLYVQRTVGGYGECMVFFAAGPPRGASNT